MSTFSLPALQTAVVVTAFEGPSKFATNTKLVHDKPVRPPVSGEVVVRLKLRPVNPADGFSVMGLYPGFAPSSLPATPGLEGVGDVAAVGEGVENLKVGQRVVPIFGAGYLQKGEGSWQQYVTINADHAVPIPDNISDESAAQLIVNPVTVVGMIHDLAIPEGEWLVQTQAGSTLGRILIQYAKQKGIKTINIVRRSSQIAELKALGADEVISTSDEDVVERVKEITGGKLAYGAVESVAGELTGKVISSVRSGGTVLIFGGASGISFSASIVDFIFRDVTLKGWWLNNYLRDLKKEDQEELFAALTDLIGKGFITPFSGEKLDLTEAVVAVSKQTVENRQGKILLVG